VSRKLIRHVTADWFNAANIPGLDMVHPGTMREIPWANHGSGANLCQAEVLVGRRPDKRIALGGPKSGQKEINSQITLRIWFRSTNTDWLEAQDDFDDITEAIVKQLRAGGRVLGRPDAVVSAGEFGQGIVQSDEEPVALDGGAMQARCEVLFEVTEVINS
jgi:hypothetical protein